MCAKYTVEDGLKTKKLPHWRPKTILVSIFAFGILATGVAMYDQLPNGQTSASEQQTSVLTSTGPSLRLNNDVSWQSYGTAAYAVSGQGIMAYSGTEERVVPTASLAKMITALAVLKKKPLQPGQQGPVITITQSDITSYEQHVRNSGSVAPIEIGEEITEYQALQAMLHISANNIADTLVYWAFGTSEAYTAYANQMLKDMGLTKTTVTDASGFSPNTTSTAGELALIGLYYSQSPVLIEIAQQKEATIPVAGIIKNYNATVNTGTQIGIKVGYTGEAGRCFVIIDQRRDKPASAVAVLGAEHIQIAMEDAKKIINAGNRAYDKALIEKP